MSRKVRGGDDASKEAKIIHRSQTKFNLLPVLLCSLDNFSGTSGKRGNLYSGRTFDHEMQKELLGKKFTNLCLQVNIMQI